MSSTIAATAESRCVEDVESEPIRWLWPHRFARGKLNLVAGQPGLGKSQITVDMAARVTTGRAWPDGSKCPVGSVVVISCEDDVGDTTRPRLTAAGADVSRVHVLDWIIEPGDGDTSKRRRTFDIGRDCEVLRELCSSLTDVALVIIDPVSAYVGGADSHKTSDVRAALAPLQALASEISACVVLVSHLNKGTADGSAMSRVSGSGAFVAAARSAWIVGHHPTDEKRRVMVPLKNNIGDDKNGFAYQIDARVLAGGIETSCVSFDPVMVQFSAEEVLSATTGGGGAAEGSALAEAEQFLRSELANGEPHDAKALKKQAKDAGVAWRTVERAKKTLNVRVSKSSGPTGAWCYHLPAAGRGEAYQDRQDRHDFHDDGFGGVTPPEEVRQALPSRNAGSLGGLGGVASHLNGSAGGFF